MPLVIDKNISFFKIRTTWFSNQPYDAEGVDRIAHMYCKEKVDAEGFTRETLSTLVIDLTKGLDPVWDGMAGDCRKFIRRAEKEGFKVNRDTNYGEFIQMEMNFRKSKKMLPYDTRIIENSEDFIKKHGTLFTAELNGQLLCGYLAIHDDKYMRGLQAASRRLETSDYLKKMIGFGNRMLVWEAIKYAASNGICEFDLGGYYTGETPDPEMEGINRFKKGFGGQLNERHSYFKDYSMSIKTARKAAAMWNRINRH